MRRRRYGESLTRTDQLAITPCGDGRARGSPPGVEKKQGGHGAHVHRAAPSADPYRVRRTSPFIPRDETD